jgi:PadR family transcriptional regulator, regulatory protein PadR
VIEYPKLSHTAALILQAIHCGCRWIGNTLADADTRVYGYNLMETTGLPSGTVYPALRRLEREGLIRCERERQSIATEEHRPPRKYYELTRSGKAALQASTKRYPLLARLFPSHEGEKA